MDELSKDRRDQAQCCELDEVEPVQLLIHRTDDVVHVPSSPPGVLATLPGLRLVQSMAAGIDHLTADPTLPRQVPLWTLDRYSPMFDAGVGASGAFYTTVVDACRPLARDEACAEWRKRLEQAEHDANLAFRDSRDALDARVAELREGLDSNCR